jgi:hypothetical protein
LPDALLSYEESQADEEVRPIADTQELKKYRQTLQAAGIQDRCKRQGFYGICYAKRDGCPDTMASVTVYYDSELDELVAMWQARGKGELQLMTLRRRTENNLERAVRQLLDDALCFLDKRWPISDNGDLLAIVRALIQPIWDKCHKRGFVGRPRSLHKDHCSAIPGSNITLYDALSGEALVIWEKDLTGPVQFASFTRAERGELEKEMRSVIGFCP